MQSKYVGKYKLKVSLGLVAVEQWVLETHSNNPRHDIRTFYPVCKWCQNDVVTTSTRRHLFASTLIRRHFWHPFARWVYESKTYPLTERKFFGRWLARWDLNARP